MKRSLSALWSAGEGPTDTGIFFPDDTWSAMIVSNDGTLRVRDRLCLNSDFSTSQYGEYENGRLVEGEDVVRWGGGSWEGEGWVSLERTDGTLVWLIHLEMSEAFTQARLYDGIVEAVAYEYPFTNTFVIPKGRPEMLVFEKLKE